MARFKEIVRCSCARWMAMYAVVSAADIALAQSGDAPAPSAERLVVVLEAPETSQRGLAAALRIQSLGSFAVQERAWTPPDAVAERIANAGELARSSGATAVVWSEPALTKPDGSREAILYMVGQHDGRALLEIVRVPGDRGPELDRTLALKVSEVVREVESAAPAAVRGELLSASLRYDAGPIWSGFSQAGVRLASALGPGELRIGAAAMLGPDLQIESWIVRLGLGLELYPALTIARQGSEVQLSELAPLAQLAWLWNGRELTFGLRAAAALSIIEARGRSARGTRGESTQRTLTGSVGIVLERPLVEGLRIAASVDLQWRALRHAFEINRESVADLGSAQLIVGVDLVFRTALIGGAAR